MSLLRKAKDKFKNVRASWKNPHKDRNWHRCRFEPLEQREMLSVSPLNVGVTYFEDSSTNDTTGDVFEVAYNGGASGSQLTQLVINTEKLSGFTNADCVFDNTSASPGVSGYSPFSVVSSDGVSLTGYTVSSDGKTLTLNFSGFDAGEKFVFRIDVDETGTDGGSPVAEGKEFEGSSFNATFTADHYKDLTVSSVCFYNEYDTYFSGKNLDLPNDAYNPVDQYAPTGSVTSAIYTAGAAASATQIEKPVSLSGYVFYDKDADNVQDANESGIQGVTLTLFKLDDEGGYVSTGLTATTDEYGYYEFSSSDITSGTYRVSEQAVIAGYMDVGATAGKVDGVTRGSVETVNVIKGIALEGGDDSVHNDFAETKPASLSGNVYYDVNNDGVFQSTEEGIAGAQIDVYSLDSEGNPTHVATTYTMPDGSWTVENLAPGKYKVVESQPDGYVDGKDTAGSEGGTVTNDVITAIPLAANVTATDYNFGERLICSVSGKVWAELDLDNVHDSNEPLLSGVTIKLYDAEGNLVATTATDANGAYSFTELAPGVYSIVETQPANYLDYAALAGSEGGTVTDANHLTSITLAASVDGTEYDFLEVVPASLSGYVFQDGDVISIKSGEATPYIPSVRDGTLTSDDTRLSGVTLVLCDGSGVPLTDSSGNQITTVTDSNGHYKFSNLMPGSYSIKELGVTGYVNGVDTSGTLGGLVVNPYATISAATLSTLAVTTSGNAIVKITLDAGENGTDYNFSWVKVKEKSSPGGGSTTTVNTNDTHVISAGVASSTFYGGSLPPLITIPTLSGGAGGLAEYTWHLSIVDGGTPRRSVESSAYSVSPQAETFDPATWTGENISQGEFVFADADGKVVKKTRFGLKGAKPIVGDFNGDGISEIAVFLNGYWFIDLDGNGVWDENDLWAKLGKPGDQGVAGDWDGDGKTDIAIYGPAWNGDIRAVEMDAGLPDVLNPPKSRFKNIPPNPAEAAVGWRTMKKTATGEIRSDVIDHVFEYGKNGDIAVVGDWNGDGVYTVGIFRKGVWFLDMDGDGRWSAGDVMVEFGQAGDVPVVGDWTGDGKTKLGVYRNGSFILDTNNNRVVDAADKVFELGGPGDKPFAGDFTGSGVSTVGVYHDASGSTAITAQAPSQTSAQ